MGHLLALAGLLLANTLTANEAETAPKPNVIIIFADDLGDGDLGVQGHERFKTPNLDRMAADGIRLTDFYVTTPFCAPSRAALLTGRYPFRNGMTRNPHPLGDLGRSQADEFGLSPNELTLAEVFKQSGYSTTCVGKWHLGHKPRFFPSKQGFDEYFGILYSNDMHPVELFEGDKRIEYPVYQPTLTKRYTQRAVDFIKRHREQPFFLYFAHAMPHKPLAASEDFYKKTGTGLYGDVIAEVDWSVGQVLDTVDKLGLSEKTLIIFTSDNGPWYGGSTGGLRGMKGINWEGGIRVPFIARWTGKIPAGRVSSVPTVSVDIFPTCLQAADIPLPKGVPLDGTSLLPLLTSDVAPEERPIFGEKNGHIYSVRQGRWKLFVRWPGQRREANLKPVERWLDPRRPDGVRIIAPYEQAQPSEYPGLTSGDTFKGIALFDLRNDPGEQKNVAGQHPDIVERLKAQIDAIQQSVAEEKSRRSPTGSSLEK
ncbi:Arylsulfatase precursor [Planctomycetes bacterium Pan216]|uniref:Arylsulfatase n=1 Tax=Kolteria novifilia TaxID=2527975 RepID=A0A518B619_9BACT|nr:Arylsulfatase precursor [Planctomycetes bacterium Pan216]